MSRTETANWQSHPKGCTLYSWLCTQCVQWRKNKEMQSVWLMQLHALTQAHWRLVWKDTIEKSQTNAAKAVRIEGTRRIGMGESHLDLEWGKRAKGEVSVALAGCQAWNQKLSFGKKKRKVQVVWQGIKLGTMKRLRWGVKFGKQDFGFREGGRWQTNSQSSVDAIWDNIFQQ